MAKAIPRRRNGRIGSRKSARRIPKGVIHVQASFNNTIITITDVRGRVVSWSSAGTCGFKEKRDTFCCSNRSRKCYSYSSRSRYATSRSHDKGSGLGRDAALRAIRRSGIFLTFIRAPRRI